MSESERTPAPVANHHADHPGFAGISGAAFALVSALTRNRAAREICDRAGVSPTDRAVDLGCGSGNAVREAARRGAEATGIDPAAVMLRVAGLLMRGPRLTWAQGTAEAIPLPDASATVLWSVAAIHHWQDVDAALAEIHRVLAPGGRFLGVERRTTEGATGLATHGWTEAQAETFAAQCRDAGFVAVTVETTDGSRGREVLVRARRPA
jgi:ubiquinone/menaquinone biosynthesis C-methylase UbiE